MSNLTLPAPLWRRLIASAYDGLLLLALWIVGILFYVIIRDLLGLKGDSLMLQVLLFVIGLFFFGWFWTHGGQTLGMRVWRLQVRRADGSDLRWPVAATRYAFAYASWACAGLGMLWCLIDGKRRSWHDIITSTEVVVLPKPAVATASSS